MAQIIEKIVKSAYPPSRTEVLWLDTKDNSLKSFVSGLWDKISAKENKSYEKVTVECNVAKLNSAGNTLEWVSSLGAKLHINSFDRTKKYDEEIIEIKDENVKKIVFNAVKGRHYVIHFTIEGNGASFYQEFDAANDSREIILWSLPIGVWHFGYLNSASDNINTYNYTATPLLSTNNSTSTIECFTLGTQYHDNKYIESTDTYSDDNNFIGVLISKSDWSAFLDEKSIILDSERNIQWAIGAEKNLEVPFIPTYNKSSEFPINEENTISEDKAGLLNTSIIRYFYPNSNIVKGAEEGNPTTYRYNGVSYVPALGQIRDIFKLKQEIVNLCASASINYLSMLFSGRSWSSDQYNNLKAWSFILSNGSCGAHNKSSKDGKILGLCTYNYLY